MESQVNASEDFLIDGLSFKMGPSASYVTQRRSVTFYPQGGNQYSPSGVKVIKLSLTGDQWLDPSTFRIMFKIQNLAAVPAGVSQDLAGTNMDNVPFLRPISGPWSFFRRMRILAGGQVLEDIDYYARAHEMFHFFQSSGKRFNEEIEGTGQYINYIVNQGLHPVLPQANARNLGGIFPGDSMTVLFKPLAGILNQPKYLPLRYCQLQIELEIVNSLEDPIIWPDAANLPTYNPAPYVGITAAGTVGLITTAKETKYFTQDNCSKEWQILEVQAKCDLCMLDNSLENEYARHLLEGKSLPIQYDTYVQQNAVIPSSDFVTNISRSFTRLKSVFVSMDGRQPGYAARNPGTEAVKWWNNFYNPMSWGEANGFINNNYQMEFQMQVGSKLYPEYPIRSQEEAFYQTMKTLGLASSVWHSVDITTEEWNSCKFLYAIDTEKVTEAGFTGLNTKAGDLIYLKLKQNQVPQTHLCNFMYVILHADQVLNIRDTGCEVFD